MMELDELKNTWKALDKSFKQNEILQETLLLEMIRGKAGKKVNRLMNYEVINVIGLIPLFPLIAYILDKYGGRLLMGDITLIYSGLFCFLYWIWAIFKLKGLMKFDFSNQISDTILCMNRYNIQIKKEQFVINFAGIGFWILGILCYTQAKANIPQWIFLFSMLVLATIYTYWAYKQLFTANIKSILKSLDEIKELQEKE